MGQFGSVWVSVGGCIWSNMAWCGSVWLSVGQCGSVWVSVDQFGSVWVGVYGLIWLGVGQFGCGSVWVSVGQVGSVWISVGQALTFPEVFISIRLVKVGLSSVGAQISYSMAWCGSVWVWVSVDQCGSVWVSVDGCIWSNMA